MRNFLVSATAGLVAGLHVMTSAAAAGSPCGLCDEEIVTNSDLAGCFLRDYKSLAERAKVAVAGAVVIDLSDCEESRGIVEALPTPNLTAIEPDVQFMLSRAQIDCLKDKLEEPGLVLDPSATIELDSCG